MNNNTNDDFLNSLKKAVPAIIGTFVSTVTLGFAARLIMTFVFGIEF